MTNAPEALAAPSRIRDAGTPSLVTRAGVFLAGVACIGCGDPGGSAPVAWHTTPPSLS